MLLNISNLFGNKKADSLEELFDEKYNQTLTALGGFSNDINEEVSIKTLRSLEIGKWYYTDKKDIKYKLTTLTEKEAVFITIMDAGAAFGIHKHDGVEKGIVVDGHLIDDLNNLVVLKNERFEYKAGQSHKPYCKIKSVYEVTFSGS